MNPAACARAKKAARLEREAATKPPEPRLLPTTPEEAAVEARREYRKATRPWRRTFRGGTMTRKQADKFILARLKQQVRAAEAADVA